MKKRGVGIAVAQYPTGLAGGGDVSQAYVKVNPDGTGALKKVMPNEFGPKSG